MKTPLQILSVLLFSVGLHAHEWHSHKEPAFGYLPADQAKSSNAASERRSVNGFTSVTSTATASPAVQRFAATFSPFKPAVRYRWDATYFYVESEGMPSHPMMVGITQWI